MDISGYIDHTLLRPDATSSQINRLCEEARAHHFAAVCVPPYFAAQARRGIKTAPVNVAVVAGFPYGYDPIDAKEASIRNSIQQGADEIDLVVNLAALRAGDRDYLKKEMLACLLPVRFHRKTIKVIIETGLLTNQQIIDSCRFYADFKIDYLKTSTGVNGDGATPAVVQLIRKNLPEEIKIKASGGIRTFALAKALIESGADRIGTSAGTDIVNGS